MLHRHSAGFYSALIVGFFVAAQGAILLPFWMGTTVDTLSLSESRGGWLATAQLGTAALATIATAALITRINKRWVYVVALLGAAAGNGLSALATWWEALGLLFACRMLAGLGEGMLIAVVTAFAAETVKPIRTFALMNGLGALIAALIFLTSPYLIAPYGAAAIYSMMSAMALLALPFVVLLQLPPSLVGSKSFQVAGRQRRGRAIFSSQGWLGLMMFGLFACVNGGTYAFAQRIGVNSVGLDLEQIGSIIAIAAALMVSGPWLANCLGGRLGQTIPLMSCVSLYSLIALSFAFANSEWLFVLAMLSHAVITGFTATFVSAFFVTLDASGRLVAAAPGFSSIGVAVGPTVMGTMIPHFPGYQAIAWVALVLLAIVGVGFMKLTLAVDKNQSPA